MSVFSWKGPSWLSPTSFSKLKFSLWVMFLKIYCGNPLFLWSFQWKSEKKGRWGELGDFIDGFVCRNHILPQRFFQVKWWLRSYFFLLLVHFSIEMGEQPLVKTVANIFREICYDNRDQLTAGIICAGWDKREGGQVCTFEWNVQSIIKNCILVIVFSTVVGQRLITSFFITGFLHPPGWNVCETAICHRR